MQIDKKIPGSFRDPDGFLFCVDGILYRQINKSYGEIYERVIKAKLYEHFWNHKMLIPHSVETIELAQTDSAYAIIKPQRVQYITYPYEWCFEQLRDAALLTLEMQKQAMSLGFSLKDASAYNIQFVDGRPIFIDTLSFENVTHRKPWVAYGQFCKHFLAPLVLMAFVDIRLSSLLQTNIDGIPLDLTSRLLPARTLLSPFILFHIHLHARMQAKYANTQGIHKNKKPLQKDAVYTLVESLTSAVKRLRWNIPKTEWGDYYQSTNYSDEAFEEKKVIVSRMIEASKPRTVWDMGANTGVFSRLALKMEADVAAFDIDPVAVNSNYIQARQNNEKLLPLRLDLTTPSPAIGWDCKERASLFERGPVDLCMALALIHHLAISNNVPLKNIAGLFASICKYLIIEFVPKEDSQVKRLLASREDIFNEYDLNNFKKIFLDFFTIIEEFPQDKSLRTLFFMKSKLRSS